MSVFIMPARFATDAPKKGLVDHGRVLVNDREATPGRRPDG
jgi:hypothetical protein